MSHPKDIPPTVVETTGPMAGQRKTHPAYGMLRFSRVSGGSNKLFGSEINHGHFIQMELTPGEEHWSLSQVWRHSNLQTLCSVRMSVAQFSELITSMNVGSGTPVTIDYINDDIGQRPGIADSDTLHQKIKDDVRKEADDAFKDADKLCKQLTDTVNASKLSKADKTELIGLVNKVTAAVHSSLPFVVDQYQEAAEKVGAKAKAELDAFATAVVQRLGQNALDKLNETPPKPALDV